MKKLLPIMISMVIISISQVCAAEETIRIANGEWLPYHSAELKYDGVVSRIVTEAFALEGVKVEYGFFPWARALDLAAHGDWDGVVPYGWSAEREKKFYYSDVVYENPTVFFHLKSKPFEWNTLADLKGLTVGCIQGNNYGEAFNKAAKENIFYVEWVPKEKHVIAKLLKGRIDIFVQDIDVGYETLRKYFSTAEFNQVTNHPKALRTTAFHLILSRKVEANKKRVLLFNKGLKKLKESGKIKQYFEESRRGEHTKK